MTSKYFPEGVKTIESNNIILGEVPAADIAEICNDLWRHHKLPLKTIAAIDDTNVDGTNKIVYIFGDAERNRFIAPYVVPGCDNEFPSIARSIHAASVFERKIKTFFGLTPSDHPNLRPIILHENWPSGLHPLRKDFDWNRQPETAEGSYPFLQVEGEGIYEIPVGPIHAGIIEPGHFRFSVAGEEIVFLELKLGYVHKGIEKLFEVLPMEQKLRLSERVSGDSSFSHSLAFCQAVEALAGIGIPQRAKYLRVIFAELERLANHFGDIGMIMTDAGFSFGGAQGTRLREMIMQWNGRLTQSRFLRGVNTYGGVTKDINAEMQGALLADLTDLRKDFTEVMAVAANSHSLLNRMKDTGVLDGHIAKDHGIVGVAARANGIAVDARKDHPYAAYDTIKFDIALEEGCDVYARFMVRVKEVASSIGIIEEALRCLAGEKKGEINTGKEMVSLQRNAFSIGIAEGWRGDITYFIATDANGNISRVDVRDPSFLNWTAVPHAVRGNVVPDFPLINKSFNLSYSGNDL